MLFMSDWGCADIIGIGFGNIGHSLGYRQAKIYREKIDAQILLNCYWVFAQIK